MNRSTPLTRPTGTLSLDMNWDREPERPHPCRRLEIGHSWRHSRPKGLWSLVILWRVCPRWTIGI